MCLGVPGAVLEIHLERDTPMGTVDFGGTTREVCLLYVPEARVGDHVIVHAGFAISVLDQAAAAEALALFAELAEP